MLFLQRISLLYLLVVLCGESLRRAEGLTSLQTTRSSRRRRCQQDTATTGHFLSLKDDSNQHEVTTENGDVDDDAYDLGSFLSFWQDRWKPADALEVRLDATICACFTLARFLAYDMTLPSKAVPSIELADVIMILDTFSSAIVLAFLWTAAGLLVRLFEDPGNGTRMVFTTLLAAPPWLLLERALSWPTSGSSDVLLNHVLLGSLGLLATMSLSRLDPLR